MTLEDVHNLYNYIYEVAKEMVTLLHEKQERVCSSEYDVLEKINEYVNEYMHPYTPVLMTDKWSRNISVSIPCGNMHQYLHCSLICSDDGQWLFEGDKNYHVQPISIIKNWPALKLQMEEKVKERVDYTMRKLKEEQEKIAEHETIIKEFVI